MAYKSDVKRLLRMARKAGLVVRVNTTSHYVIETADGQRVTTVSQSPGSRAALNEAKSRLRKAGVDVGDSQKPPNS